MKYPEKIAITLLMIVLVLVAIIGCQYSTSLVGGWRIGDNYKDGYISKDGSKEGDPFIPCALVNYAHNDQFLIVAQKPSLDCGPKSDFFNTGNPVNFWIIDIGSNKVIGPLSFNEYFQKRQELNIPDDLQMDLKI